MQLKCLGSNSSGNCYLLESEEECLVLEAGLPFKDVKIALDFNIDKIVGLLVTHEHGDHFKYVKDFLNAGIPIKASQGTWSTLPYDIEISEKVVRPGYWYQLGNFTITPFLTIHDAVEPLGFLIRHPSMGSLLFATDTEYIKQDFSKLYLNHILIECNYSQDIINSKATNENINNGLRDRILQTHMELDTCRDFVRHNATSVLTNIILLHLSDGNSDEVLFKDEIRKVVGSGTKVFVADKGLTVELDYLPFA